MGLATSDVLVWQHMMLGFWKVFWNVQLIVFNVIDEEIEFSQSNSNSINYLFA